MSYGGERLDRCSEKRLSELRRTEFGVVFQFGQLIPELTALDNVALPLLLAGAARADARGRAGQWLERFGVRGQAELRPGEMSGGQAQRAALARALVTGPKVVFADEPTGALDSLASEQVMTALVHTARESGTAVAADHPRRPGGGVRGPRGADVGRGRGRGGGDGMTTDVRPGADLRLAWLLTRGSDRREWWRVGLTAVGAAHGDGLRARGRGGGVPPGQSACPSARACWTTPAPAPG